MRNTTISEVLSLLDVRLDAFATCEIAANCGLACPPMDTILIHYVLQGEGTIECALGRYPLRPGTVAIIPKNLAKVIEGPGPRTHTVALDEGCPLVPGMVRYRASPGSAPGLVLGCASISASVGGGRGLFDSLVEPLIHVSPGETLPMLFAAMAGELKLPSVGTKAMVEALMKQVLVLVLRRGAASPGGELSLRLLLADPRIGRVVATIVAHPGHPHSVDSLAAAAGMSRSCFNRQFAVAYEGTPMDFVQGVRLREAARMLTASNLPVKSVAAAVGFTSRSHFSRAFTLKFGLDPSRYRSLPADESSGTAPSHDLSFSSGI